ncbi:MAG: prepilin-type N-terminal cleavage/methylation domain-containing protein [Alphaproteobacteria bacterium]|nr:prepilin-type N-terminal cleavage/methylation domain-containing protein [Alphaproteobacteria bacterium]
MRGFSLVELSIVLVILGLLTGGILAGQSLIRASELRAVTSEYQRYTAAGNTFRDKYFAIPGDFRDATRFWTRGVAAAHCVSQSGAAVGSPGACDGDGNGFISYALASESAEGFQFWRHLALAGLVEGSYTGIASAGGSSDATIGTNVPASKLGNAAWSFQNASNYVGDGSTYAMDYGNMFNFGGKTTNALTYATVLKPEEAWNIDTKMDDGKPASGKVIARYWNNACSAADDGTHANNDLVASYKLSDSTLQCALHFRHPF